MPRETRPTARASKPTRPHNRGAIYSKRYAVSSSGITIPVPASSREMVVKNVGNQELQISFNNDLPTDFYPLLKDERTPTLQIIENTEIKAKAKNGSTEAVLLLWG